MLKMQTKLDNKSGLKIRKESHSLNLPHILT